MRAEGKRKESEWASENKTLDKQEKVLAYIFLVTITLNKKTSNLKENYLLIPVNNIYNS